MKMIAYLLAIVCVIAAVMYFVMPAGQLPTFMPGYLAGSEHIHKTHAIAAAVAAVVPVSYTHLGGNVVVDDPKLLNAKRPVAPIDLTEKMTCPLLGIFGNDDANPTADQVNRTEVVLKLSLIHI